MRGGYGDSRALLKQHLESTYVRGYSGPVKPVRKKRNKNRMPNREVAKYLREQDERPPTLAAIWPG